MSSNRHESTVEGFGDEWHRYDQSALSQSELAELFERYFRIFPWDRLEHDAVGFDMGCGSGRWAKLVAPKVGKLFCVDPSSALQVAKSNLRDAANCMFVNGGVGDHVFERNSMDFGYSLGVLHHVPNTADAIEECASFLKPGSPFLIYLYYRFDNRSPFYKAIWKLSEVFRAGVSKLPHGPRYLVSNIMAALVYFPLSSFALVLERIGISKSVVDRLPLATYRGLSFYTMRTDALDRFGTQLEQRFTKSEIVKMMNDAGLGDVRFSDEAPFWCAVGFKK